MRRGASARDVVIVIFVFVILVARRSGGGGGKVGIEKVAERSSRDDSSGNGERVVARAFTAFVTARIAYSRRSDLPLGYRYGGCRLQPDSLPQVHSRPTVPSSTTLLRRPFPLIPINHRPRPLAFLPYSYPPTGHESRIHPRHQPPPRLRPQQQNQHKRAQHLLHRFR